MLSPPPSLAPDAPLVIVLNAGSGHDDATETRRTIEQVLSDAGRRHETMGIEKSDDVAEVAMRGARRACEIDGAVVAAGGDGTINAVAQAALKLGCPMGVLPQGTFNYFGRHHGIPADTAAASRALLRAVPTPIQLGLVNDHAFLVNASLGLYPRLLEDREEHKRRFGRSRLVAAAAALRTALGGHPPLHLTLSGSGIDEQRDVATLFIANNALQLEQIGIDAAPLDGGLVAITQAPMGAFGLLALMARGMMGRLQASPEVQDFAFRSLTVARGHRRRAAKFKVATDGEVLWMDPPLVFRAAPGALVLLVPHPQDAVARR